MIQGVEPAGLHTLAGAAVEVCLGALKTLEHAFFSISKPQRTSLAIPPRSSYRLLSLRPGTKLVIQSP
jgi:hypothetical protein